MSGTGSTAGINDKEPMMSRELLRDIAIASLAIGIAGVMFGLWVLPMHFGWKIMATGAMAFSFGYGTLRAL